MRTDAQIETLLEAHGWSLECTSPMELRHLTTGSFASGLAAQYVLAGLQEESQCVEQVPSKVAAVLLATIEQVQSHVRTAQNLAAENPANADEAWKTAYCLVFSGGLAKSISACCQQLGVAADWDDPDGSYQDDVKAFANQMQERLELLKAFFPDASSR